MSVDLDKLKLIISSAKKRFPMISQITRPPVVIGSRILFQAMGARKIVWFVYDTANDSMAIYENLNSATTVSKFERDGTELLIRTVDAGTFVSVMFSEDMSEARVRWMFDDTNSLSLGEMNLTLEEDRRTVLLSKDLLTRDNVHEVIVLNKRNNYPVEFMEECGVATIVAGEDGVMEGLVKFNTFTRLTIVNSELQSGASYDIDVVFDDIHLDMSVKEGDVLGYSIVADPVIAIYR